MTLLDSERKKRHWRRFLPLWGGAVAVGLAVGIGPTLWSQTSAPTPSAATVAPQTIPQEVPTVEDEAWASREVGGSGEATTTGDTVSFGLCHTGGGTNCVVDGDTIWVSGQDIRIADIDAPETHEFRCPEEKALGDRATERLYQLVNSGAVTLRPIGNRDEDVYGRKLRLVMVNGTSVGETLVSEGLARYYEGGKKPWC